MEGWSAAGKVSINLRRAPFGGFLVYDEFVNQYVARLKWEGLEVETGLCEQGELNCRLEDVVITTNILRKGEQLLIERVSAIMFGGAASPEEVERIQEEIASDPSADDVLATWFQKSIQLSPRYSLGYSEHPENHPVTGFGFMADIGELPTGPACGLTSSWDWFNVVSSGKAVKLQESGEINFDVVATPSGVEILRMFFATDVSFRIRKRQSQNTREPDWRIRVGKGSEILWPSLVGGKKIANGFVR